MTYDDHADCANHVHNIVCGNHNRAGCVAGPSIHEVKIALDHLELFPRDAKGTRGLLHDLACQNGCVGEQRDAHAKRQTAKVVAIRKWRATA